VFCFSIWVLADLQKCHLVWYTSKQGGAHNPSIHSRHLNFVLVSFFLAEHMRHQILLQHISQGLLCLVSTLFRWLVDGACLPCLAIKRLSREGSSLMWGGSVCRYPLTPPVNLWTTSTVIRQFVLSVLWSLCQEHPLSLSLSLQAQMTWSTDECASRVQFLYQFYDVLVCEFSPYSHTGKCTLMQRITAETHHLRQRSCFKCLNCWDEDREKHEPTIPKSYKEILTAKWRTFAYGPILH
jgi:hypothetical protein